MLGTEEVEHGENMFWDGARSGDGRKFFKKRSDIGQICVGIHERQQADGGNREMEIQNGK